MPQPRKKSPLPPRGLLDPLEQLAEAQRKEKAKLFAARPKRMADVVNQVMARRGYARVRASDSLSSAWQQAAGEEFARHSHAGRLARGTLEVIVANSTLLQELNFVGATLLADLQRLLPDEQIRRLRFKIGTLG